MLINEITREESEKILKDIYEKENDRSIYRMKNRLSPYFNETDKWATGFYHWNELNSPDRLNYDRIKFFHFQGRSAFGRKEDIVCVIGSIDDIDDKNSHMYIINIYGNKKNVLDFNNCFKFEINKGTLRIIGYKTVLFDDSTENKNEVYYKEQFYIKIKNSDNIETLADYMKNLEDNICARIIANKHSYKNFAFGVYIYDIDNGNEVKERFIIRSEEKGDDYREFLFSLFRQVPESIPDNDCLNVYNEDIKNLHECGIVISENELPNKLSNVLNNIFYTSAVYVSSETTFAYANNLEALNTVVARKVPIGKDVIFNIEYNPDLSLDHKHIMIHIEHRNFCTNHQYIVSLTNTPEERAYIKENYYKDNDYLGVLGFIKEKIR